MTFLDIIFFHFNLNVELEVGSRIDTYKLCANKSKYIIFMYNLIRSEQNNPNSNQTTWH